MGGTLGMLDTMVTSFLLLGFLTTLASTFQSSRFDFLSIPSFSHIGSIKCNTLVRSGDFSQQGSKMSPVITSQTRTFRAPVSDEVGKFSLWHSPKYLEQKCSKTKAQHQSQMRLEYQKKMFQNWSKTKTQTQSPGGISASEKN